MLGYKLFEMNSSGDLFPLFIGKNQKLKIGEWIHAEFIPTKGFATRGGWHIGEGVPDAPWLKGYDGTDCGCYKPRFKNGKRVWCEVEYNTNHCYDDEVSKLKSKCFKDKIPEDGYYKFREVGNRIWVITSDIKINRIISENERQEIMKSIGYDEVKEYAKYKSAFEKKLKNKGEN